MAKRSPFWQEITWRFEAMCVDLFVAAMRALPVDTVSDLGAWLARTFGPMTPVQRTVSRNLQLAFPQMSDADRKRLSDVHWENTGRSFFEAPVMGKMIREPERIEIEGMEKLHAIRDSGRPVIFISGHISNWEVMNVAILWSGVPYMITYRSLNNPYVNERLKEWRYAYGVRSFAPKGSDGAKELLVALNDGQSVGLMNDQKFNRGVPTPFFGHVCETAPGPTRLAQRYGTVLQPLTIRRTHKARFHVTVHDPISVDDTGHKAQDIDTTVNKITAFIEEAVRANPEEYFWTHKRWPNALYKSA